MEAVKLQNISFRYGRNWTLIDISTGFQAGKTTLITGDNGAGKTTLLRIISTAMRPTRGTYEVFGKNAFRHKNEIRKLIGFISHSNYLYYDLSALENLQLVNGFIGLGMTEQEVFEILERVNLAAYAHVNVRNFSAGMKRRLAIARLLLNKPKLIILDEPFGQLDPRGVQLMLEIIQEFQKNGSTIVFSSHMHEIGQSLCDEHLHMKQGRIATQSIFNKATKEIS